MSTSATSEILERLLREHYGPHVMEGWGETLVWLNAIAEWNVRVFGERANDDMPDLTP